MDAGLDRKLQRVSVHTVAAIRPVSLNDRLWARARTIVALTPLPTVQFDASSSPDRTLEEPIGSRSQPLEDLLYRPGKRFVPDGLRYRIELQKTNTCLSRQKLLPIDLVNRTIRPRPVNAISTTAAKTALAGHAFMCSISLFPVH